MISVSYTHLGDERHDAAGAQLVDALGKEIVVNGKMQPVILRVIDLEIAERDIANNACLLYTSSNRFSTNFFQ